ncbi:hypothetical protein ACFQ3Z_38375 [Streptomyces nogalater]
MPAPFDASFDGVEREDFRSPPDEKTMYSWSAAYEKVRSARRWARVTGRRSKTGVSSKTPGRTKPGRSPGTASAGAVRFPLARERA